MTRDTSTQQTIAVQVNHAQTRGAYRDLDFAQLIEEDVCWLEVIMDDASAGPI